jgi:DNA primase
VQLPSFEQKAFFEIAVMRYQSDLLADTAAQEYLLSRGFSREAALTFRLGVVGTPAQGHERFRGRLAIPYLTRSGVVNIVFRCLKPHICKLENCPKYLAQPGLDRNLYNVNDTFVDSPFICVTEGELDALTLSAAGFPAVGVGGVENWKTHFGRVLEDFAEILVLGDGDEAGQKFSSFLVKEAKARQVTLPKGEDCNDIHRRDGVAGLRKLIGR